jgi:hypothetical protein
MVCGDEDPASGRNLLQREERRLAECDPAETIPLPVRVVGGLAHIEKRAVNVKENSPGKRLHDSINSG